MLTHWQLKPMAVDSAQTALSMMKQAEVESNPFSVATIDIDMPETDGLVLVESMRANQQLREIPVAMLTSASKEHDLVRYQQLGVVGDVVKPIKRSF